MVFNCYYPKGPYISVRSCITQLAPLITIDGMFKDRLGMNAPTAPTFFVKVEDVG